MHKWGRWVGYFISRHVPPGIVVSVEARAGFTSSLFSKVPLVCVVMCRRCLIAVIRDDIVNSQSSSMW